TVLLTTIANQIKSGFNNGAWTGSGISSSAAAAVAKDSGNPHKTAIGYATAGAIGISTFAGEPVIPSSIVARYTLSADANLDGVVNALDFNALASHFGASDAYWFNGDYNYDGTVSTSDFAALAVN